jgi:hypothetical protein
MSKFIKHSALFAIVALLLSACEWGSLNTNYQFEIKSTGKVSGVFQSEFPQARVRWYESQYRIRTPLVINNLSYDYNVETCQLENIQVNVINTADGNWIGLNAALANLEFENLDYPLSSTATITEFINGSSEPNLIGTDFNTGCVNPGNYIEGSGFITTSLNPTEFVLDLGFETWDSEAQKMVAISNIHPSERPYMYALQSICAQVEGDLCSAPEEISDKVAALFDVNTDFATASSSRWEKGAFATFLSDNGVEPYRTADNGYGVRVYYTNKPITSMYRETSGQMGALPNWSPDNWYVWNMTADLGDFRDEEDVITNPVDETQFWLAQSMDETLITHSVKAVGLILDTNGTYNKKTNKISWTFSEYGDDASYTAEMPDASILPGQTVTFRKNSSKLTVAAKKLLRSKKSLFQTIGNTAIIGVYDSSLDPDSEADSQELALKRAMAIKKYLNETLKLNYLYDARTVASSSSGSNWADASVNKAVVSSLGLLEP